MAASFKSNKTAKGEKDSNETAMDECRRVFQVFDKNNDGKISKKELKKALKTLGRAANKTTVEAMMAEADVNSDGYIDYAEFCRYVTACEADKQHEQETLDAFQAYDLNGDGYIDVEEIKEVMKKIDLGISNDEAVSMIRNADVNGDGRVDLKEFAKFMRNIDPESDKEFRDHKRRASGIKRGRHNQRPDLHQQLQQQKSRSSKSPRK